VFDENLIERIESEEPLPREFYAKNVVIVSQNLLGKILVRVDNEKILAGRIVEVEAYDGEDDPASHAYKGMTERNKVMWDFPGKVYVYTIYGIHYCLNIVAEPKGVPAAVLIRALQPLVGIREMMKNRNIKDVRNLTNGPARLTKALNITKDLNGVDATLKSELYVVRDILGKKFEIGVSTRIGITRGKEKPWRFYIRNNPFTSKKEVR